MKRSTDRMKPDHATLQQAADWYARLQAPDVDAGTRAAWRDWHAQGDMQRQAWHYVERVSQRFATLRQEGDDARQTLESARRAERSRRQVLRSLSVLCGGALLGWATWRATPLPGLLMAWRADYRGTTGEIREITLVDGTRLWLNGASALDVGYRNDIRQLYLLDGEVLIETARDNRPFVVETAQGRLLALGTRFSVRMHDERTLLNVFEGAVQVHPRDGGQQQVLPAGRQVIFDHAHIGTSRPASSQRQSWRKGILLADDITLGELVGELQGHHRGYLGVAPDIAGLRVMGTYPLNDSEQALAMLERVLPIRVRRPLPWWTTLEARQTD